MRTIFKRQKYFSILFILGLLVGLLSLTPAKVVSSSEAGNPNISFNIPLLDESQSFVGNKSNPVSDFALSNLNINHKLSVKAKTASLDLQNTLIEESSRSGYNLDTRFLPAQQQLQIENAYIIVATDQGVYYTKNINNSTPVWYPLNDGFVTSEDKNVYDLWYDGTGTEVTVGPLWAATASGLWRNANPLGGGTWQKLTPTDPPNLWEDSPAPTAGELSFVKVAGTAGGIVYALAQWQNGSDQYRGWLLKTDSLGQSWSWNAVIKPTNLISNGDFEEGHIDGWTNGYINTDPAYVRNGSYSLRMGPAAWGTTGRFYFEVPVTGVYLAGSWYRQGGTSAWGSVDLNGSGACQIHNSRYGDQWAYNEIACPLSAGTNRIDFNSPPYNGLSYIDDLSVIYSHLYEETKPFSLAFDPNNADKIYVTVYKEGRLYHETFDESLTLTESVDFGPATLADVDGRQKYLATYVPEVGVAADTVYAYGRYEIDNQIIHLSQSIDGGTTFERVDDTAGWGNEWLGALYVADENDFVAYTNSLGMLPYHTVDGGSNWTAGNNLVHNIGTAWGDTTSAKGGLVGRYAGAWLSDQALIWQSVTGGPWVDKTGNLYSVSSGTRVQRIIGIDLTILVYHPDSSFDPDECPPTGCNNNANNFTKRPINTRTGNYNYQTTDLSLTTVGQPLRFERTYNSMTITDTTTGVYSQTLGYGWTHNYDLDLTFADDPGGEEGMVILKAPHGSRLRFFDNGDGTYDPYPGVWAEMTRHEVAGQGSSAPYTYVITAANQTVYTFSEEAQTLEPILQDAFDGYGENQISNPEDLWWLVLSDMDDLEYFDGTVLTSEATDYFLEGEKSLKFTPNTPGGIGAPLEASVVKDVSWDLTQEGRFTNDDYLIFDYYVEALAGNGPVSITFYFSDAGAGGGVFIWEETTNSLGWHHARIKRSDFTVLSGTPSWTSIDQWQISVMYGGQPDPVVHIDNVRFSKADPDDPTTFNDTGTVWDFPSGQWHIYNDTGSYSLGQIDAESGGEKTALIHEAPARDNIEYQAAVRAKNHNGQVGLTFKMSDGTEGSEDGYAFMLDTATDQLALRSYANGTPTALASPVAFTNAVTDTWYYLGVKTEGDQIRAYASAITSTDLFTDTNLVFDVTDATHTSGQPGLMTIDTLGRFDDVSLLETYEQPSHLLSIRDPQGNLTDFGYDGPNLTVITDTASSRYLTLGYDTQNRLSSVTDHAQRTTHYGYDIDNNLTVYTDTRQLAWTYTYTTINGNPHYLHEVIDPDGRIVEKTFFDSAGRATRQEDGLGQTLASIDYISGDDISGTRVVMENGEVVTDTYDARGVLVSQERALNATETYTETFDFDGSFNRDEVKDGNGNITRYARDAMGLTYAITQTIGGQEITTTFTYDDNNNLESSTDALRRITAYTYEGNNLKTVSNPSQVGGTTVYTYNTAGQTTAVQDENGNVTRYGYDTLGNRTVITDALGYTTRYEYDDLGRVITTTDALNKKTMNDYDPADNLTKVIENYQDGEFESEFVDEDITTQYGYDGAGRRTVITDTLGRVTRNYYDAAGRLEQTIENVHPTQTGQNYNEEHNLTTTYGYDEFGRQIAITDTLNHVSRTFYDEATGRVDHTVTNFQNGSYNPTQPDEDIVTQYLYDANGNVVKTIELPGTGLERATCTVYDALNRVERTIENCVVSDENMATGPYSENPDEDLVTVYTYDAVGNQKMVLDPLERPTTYDYDALNRVITVTNAIEDGTVYGYDLAGNRTRVTNARDKATTYQYDKLNRVVTTTNALNDSTYVYYNEVGNRTDTVDANGIVTHYDYDGLYRVLTTTLNYDPGQPADSDTNVTTAVTYDALGNRLTVTDPEEMVTRTQYDTLNRPTIVTLNYINGGPSDSDTNVQTSVTYDALGRRTQVVDSRNNPTYYGYDDLGRTTAITDALGHPTTTIYDGRGNRRFVTNAENETTEFIYDDAGRLVSVVDNMQHTTVYTYNKAGERTGMADAETIATRYDYDDLGRLRVVTENYVAGAPADNQTNVATRYGYDAVGNRTVITNAKSLTTTYVYDDFNRRTESRDALGYVTAYGYDKVGNRTAITDANTIVTTFNYDDLNRLTDILYSDPSSGSGQVTPDVTFTYDRVGNRLTMSDGVGQTLYGYDGLYRLEQVTQPSAVGGQPSAVVGYGYDAVGNRTRLTYPDSRAVSYVYDDANRLDTVTDWNTNQYDYTYDDANRLDTLALPNTVTSDYDYDNAGRLTQLTHATTAETLASYAYVLDDVGNRRILTETLTTVSDIPLGTYLESNGLAVMEAENGQRSDGLSHTWLTSTAISGYTGTNYLHVLPDTDTFYPTEAITDSPKVEYQVNFSEPATYTVWARGYADNADADALNIGLADDVTAVTGFAPETWDWAGGFEELVIETSGVHTLTVWMAEDGFRLDRLLLTTDTAFIPSNFGPTESERQTAGSQIALLEHTIVYTYDNLYRLTHADYSTGKLYAYDYDPVGNRLQQIINGDTTSYQYDAANRLEAVDGQSYTFDANGNLLQTGVMTNSWDAANRLVETERVNESASQRMEPIYNGVGDRVGQTVGATTTHYALDIQGLPEAIQTSPSTGSGQVGNSYLHLPGVIVAESAAGEVRYLLSDGLGSIRQVVDETSAVVDYNEFNPYGNPVTEYGIRTTPYGFTGEWWEDDLGLLYLRARWYLAETGTFLSKDPVEGEPPYAYVRGDPINYTDSSGKQRPPGWCPPGTICPNPWLPRDWSDLLNYPVRDPLTPEQWEISKREAQRFLVPVELVAGTVAVEIVFDTDIKDIAGDLALMILVQRHFVGDCASTILLDLWEENRRGPTGEVIGPGVGVGGVHTATAKDLEDYYAENGLGDYLPSPPDKYWRMMALARDEVNIRYITAYLRQLADIRKDTSATTSHLTDLNDVDMQIIYGAYRSGIFGGYGGIEKYQRWTTPGDRGREIAPYLPFYRRKALRE